MDDTVISTDRAIEIARGYQAPHNTFSAFAHGFEVNAFAFVREIEQEIDEQPKENHNELLSLIDYVESSAMIGA